MRPALKLILIVLSLTAGLAAQDHVLIQNAVGGSNQYIANTSKSQVFTMPQAGTLSRVRIRVKGGAGATLVYDLCNTTPSPSDPAGVPLFGAPLYTGSTLLPAGTNYRDVDLDLLPSGHVATAGEFLAIRMHMLSGCYLEAGASDPYSGGGLWVDSGSSISLYPGQDLTFAVYVLGGKVSDTESYFEDFENGPRGWTVDNGLWELGTPAQSFISQAYSGANCWMTDLDASYPAFTQTAVSSDWFDFSATSIDPRIVLAVTYRMGPYNDGVRLEIDRDDGQGFQQIGDFDWYDAADSNPTSPSFFGQYWGGGNTRAWTSFSHSLNASAGLSRVRLRLIFNSDAVNTSDGFAFDDIKIEVPQIVVSDSVPYYEEFEEPSDGWISEYTTTHAQSNANGPIWERGRPSGLVLTAAHSGGHCWGTNLDGQYPGLAIATLTSPSCDLSAVSVDPVLEFALLLDARNYGGKDGLRVEVDYGDGNGFQTLGTTSDWYDDTLSANFGAGGVGWIGTSNGWRILRHELTGAGGLTGVRIRFLFSANAGGQGEGSLVDDVRIFVPTFPGTESTLADDIRMQVFIDGEREVGRSDACDVLAGEQIEVLGVSPEGDLVGGEYYLVGEVFATGASYTSVASDVWISLGAGSVLLQGGMLPPFYVPMQMGPWGQSHFYYYGGGAAGYSCRVQAIVFLPTAMNGLYASSDAFELMFQ